jgi:hypothetical protein
MPFLVRYLRVSLFKSFGSFDSISVSSFKSIGSFGSIRRRREIEIERELARTCTRDKSNFTIKSQFRHFCLSFLLIYLDLEIVSLSSVK